MEFVDAWSKLLGKNKPSYIGFGFGFGFEFEFELNGQDIIMGCLCTINWH